MGGGGGFISGECMTHSMTNLFNCNFWPMTNLFNCNFWFILLFSQKGGGGGVISVCMTHSIGGGGGN